MTNKDERIVGGLGIKEDINNEKISGGLGIKEEPYYPDIKYRNIHDNSNNNTDINIPMGNYHKPEYRNPEPVYYTKRKKSNTGLKIAVGVVSTAVVLSLGFVAINNINGNKNDNGGSIIVDNGGNKEPEIDATYNPGDKTTFKDTTKRPDTKLTNEEKTEIEYLFENFYYEHIYATNNNYAGYVMDYLTTNGDYRSEYKKLIEAHFDLNFELIELDVLSIKKENNNTYMVTVKDKMYVDRPENLSIQACKTVYEVRKIDNEYLIHSIKSETKIADESKVIETKQPTEEPTEEPIENYSTDEAPIYDNNGEEGDTPIDTYME